MTEAAWHPLIYNKEYRLSPKQAWQIDPCADRPMYMRFLARFNTYNAEILLYKQWRPKGLFQFEVILNVLSSSSRFIWIPMLCVYGYYNSALFEYLCYGSTVIIIVNSFSAGIDFRRQNLTSIDVKIWRPSLVPALKGLNQKKPTAVGKIRCNSSFKQRTDSWKHVSRLKKVNPYSRGSTSDVRIWRQ